MKLIFFIHLFFFHTADSTTDDLRYERSPHSGHKRMNAFKELVIAPFHITAASIRDCPSDHIDTAQAAMRNGRSAWNDSQETTRDEAQTSPDQRDQASGTDLRTVDRITQTPKKKVKTANKSTQTYIETAV